MNLNKLQDRKHSISIQTSHTTVKHGSGGVVIGARFAATGLGHLAVIKSNMNFYQKNYNRTVTTKNLNVT